MKLVKYSDFNWAKKYIDRKYISKFVFILNKDFISYASKK